MNINTIGIPLEGFAEFSRTVASEGAVLLKNVDQALPLKASESISVFGRTQIDYYRSGTGSGGSVHVPYTIHLLDGLRYHTTIRVNETLAQTYEDWIKAHPFDNGGGGWAAEPWHQEEMPLSHECVQAASQFSHKAIVVIGRTAGEDQDNANVPGSYLLTEDEKQMLRLVTYYFEQTIVVLNVPNIIDMSWINDPEYLHPINSVIYAWQGGMEGGRAIADILVGAVTPSGKLTDTIAYSIDDYPSTCNYGHPIQNIYQEDIYVGYRYFETFAPEKVQFEFGYGLSYTTFNMIAEPGKIISINNEQYLRVQVTVQNTGKDFSGKEVVQLYFCPPQGQLGKPVKSLLGFAKTHLLAPGESQTLVLEVPLHQMSSYDDSGITGHPFAYVLEAGEYTFFIGNSSRDIKSLPLDLGSCYYQGNLEVVCQLQQALAPREGFTRIKPGLKKEDGTYTLSYEEVPTQRFSLAQRIQENLPPNLPLTGCKHFTLKDVYDKKINLETFIAQLSTEELATLVRGEGMGSPLVTPGTASAFGGVSKALQDYGIPVACAADGPSGIRMDSGHQATQVPIGTLLAATWDLDLVEALYEMEGQELQSNQIDILLGPGLNIRRNPLNGRNFEYFSEDPLITGLFATAITKGLHKGGAHATLKHFACNNQEHSRYTVNAIVSERALREIYLKGFEMAVKKGHAKAVMTAYNPLNGWWTASNYDLTTTILRKEWDFKGIVMTDWWAMMNDVVSGGEPTLKDTRSMVRAQNDLYMVVNNYGAEVNSHEDNTLSALETHALELGELQRSAMNICHFLMDTPAFFRPRKEADVLPTFTSNPSIPSDDIPLLSEALTIDLTQQSTPTFYVTQPGTYYMIVNMMSPEGPIAQTACNICLNNQLMTTIQTGGTMGRWVKQKLPQIQLEKGTYTLSFDFIKPGLQLAGIEIISL